MADGSAMMDSRKAFLPFRPLNSLKRFLMAGELNEADMSVLISKFRAVGRLGLHYYLARLNLDGKDKTIILASTVVMK